MNDSQAVLQSAFETCVLIDRFPYSRVIGRGPDLLDLLHRLSTADLKALSPGEGTPTVLTSPKGRIVERLFVNHLGEGGGLLVGSPGSAERVIAHLERYTFSENTGLSDESASTCHWALVGPGAGDALAAAGLPRPQPLHGLAHTIDGAPAHVLGHDGLFRDAYSVLAAAGRSAAIRDRLAEAVAAVGGHAAGEQTAEAVRILRGIGAGGLELTEERNPLEAGLEDAISFDKGCYVGQEVVARLRTYDKVSRRLVGLEFAEGATAPAPGARLLGEKREVGHVTSAIVPPGWTRPVALAFIKHRDVEIGASVTVARGDAGQTARVVELPWSSPRQVE